MTQTLYDSYGHYWDNFNNVGDTLPDGLGVSKTRVGEGPGFVLEFTTANGYLTNFTNPNLYNLPYWFFNATGNAPESDNYYPESYLFANSATWRTLSSYRASLKILFRVTLNGNPFSGVAFGGNITDANGEVFLHAGNPYSGTWTPIKTDYAFTPSSVTYTGLTNPVIETFTAVSTMPSKPTTPTPANDATEIDWSAKGLSWVDGGGADTYSVYFGLNGALQLISSAQAGTSITVDDEDIPYPDEGGAGAKFYWRVDATNGSGTTTGDTWNFDARPAKATVPSPTNAANNVRLNQTILTWENGGGATSYSVYYGDTSGDLVLISEGQEGVSLSVIGITLGSPYEYTTTRYWRVDSVNEYGITEGDEWSFTTIAFAPPGPAAWNPDDLKWYIYDKEVFNPNFISTNRRLVAAAENRIWYEDL